MNDSGDCDRREASSNKVCEPETASPAGETHALPGATATGPLRKQADQAEIRRRTTKKERRVTVPFLLVCLDDYCKETSSIRKVVDNEKSVVQRNCSRIVCPL